MAESNVMESKKYCKADSNGTDAMKENIESGTVVKSIMFTLGV